MNAETRSRVGGRGEGLEAEAFWAAVGDGLDPLVGLCGFNFAEKPSGLRQAGAPPGHFHLASVRFVEHEADL